MHTKVKSKITEQELRETCLMKINHVIKETELFIKDSEKYLQTTRQTKRKLDSIAGRCLELILQLGEIAHVDIDAATRTRIKALKARLIQISSDYLGWN